MINKWDEAHQPTILNWCLFPPTCLLQWYKFRVNKMKSASVVVGLFIEYGNIEEVKISETKPLPSSGSATGKAQGNICIYTFAYTYTWVYIYMSAYI